MTQAAPEEKKSYNPDNPTLMVKFKTEQGEEKRSLLFTSTFHAEAGKGNMFFNARDGIKAALKGETGRVDVYDTKNKGPDGRDTHIATLYVQGKQDGTVYFRNKEGATANITHAPDNPEAQKNAQTLMRNMHEVAQRNWEERKNNLAQARAPEQAASSPPAQKAGAAAPSEPKKEGQPPSLPPIPTAEVAEAPKRSRKKADAPSLTPPF